jgi:hypothetical protein
MKIRAGLMLGATICFTGCAHVNNTAPSGGRPADSGFELKQLGKGDLDKVADIHRREIFASLQALAEKLYRRNPREWKKSGFASREEAMNHLFAQRTDWRPQTLADLPGFAALGEKRSTEVILSAFSKDYAGDRVAAFIVGTGDMLDSAFEGKTEFFLFDNLVPQKLYNSARNLEIAAWKLANVRDAEGTPLLLSNASANEAEPANLSFEREFGKMISNLDLLSLILADRSNRTITRVATGIASSLATAAFLPVPSLK